MVSKWITPSRNLACTLLFIAASADDSDEDSHEDDTDSVSISTVAIIVGSIIGAIFVAGLLALCCWFLTRRFNWRRRNNGAIMMYATATSQSRPIQPSAPMATETTFSENPYIPVHAGQTVPMVTLRDESSSQNGHSVAGVPKRRSSPPPPYESLFSQSENQDDTNQQTKHHHIQNE